MSRRLAQLMCTILLAALAVVLPSGVASADTTKTRNFNEAFVSTGTVRMYNPDICMRWRVDGVKSYRGRIIHRTPTVGDDEYIYDIDNVKLSGMSFTLTGFKPDGASCPNVQRKNWNQIQMEAHARGYTCSYDPEISASLGFPASFGISLNLWPDCGETVKTIMKIEVIATKSTQELRNDPQVVSFNAAQTKSFAAPNTNIDWKCYGVNFGFQVTVNKTNSWIGPRVPACPNWNGSASGF